MENVSGELYGLFILENSYVYIWCNIYLMLNCIYSRIQNRSDLANGFVQVMSDGDVYIYPY